MRPAPWLRLGVLDAIAATAFSPDVLRLFDGLSGTRLATVPLGQIAEERYSAPYLTLHRADLHASLLAACRADGAIELRSGFDATEAETARRACDGP